MFDDGGVIVAYKLDGLEDRPSPVGEQSDDTSQQLVFPFNVHESLAASGGLKKGEKTSIVISFWIFGCVVLAWVLGGWLRQIAPSYYFWIIIGIEIVLQLTVGTFLLRWVLDERTLFSEMENSNNTFAKYFGIYHELISEQGAPYPFDVMEFTDGSHGVYIQLLLGYCTNQVSVATYEVNKAIQTMINKSGMSYEILYANERFGNSSAAEELRKTVKGVSDPRLFKVYRDVVQGILNIADEESNTLSTTYVINAKTRIQKEELVQLVTNILNLIAAEETVYREAVTLSYDDIVELYRTYYKLDVLDMGLIRVHAVQRKNISCALKLLKVYGKSGRVYSTQDMQKLKSDILKTHGLEQVNREV